MSNLVPIERTVAPAGVAALSKISPPPLIPVTDSRALLAMACPQVGLPDVVNEWRVRNLPNYLDSWERVSAALRTGLQVLIGSLYVKRLTADGDVDDLGLVSHRVVTTAAVNKMVDGLRTADPNTFQNWKWHAIGTGTNAENIADTALQTEQGANYATPGQRSAGSQLVGASANIYRTVGIVTVGTLGSSLSITEHGVFSAQGSGTGTLLDRSVFSGSPIALNSNESIQATYDLTIAAGG